MKSSVVRNIIIPCNKKIYDIDGAFSHLKCIDYRQRVDVQIGAKAYIYSGKPFESALIYECEVLETGKQNQTIDDSKYEKIPILLPKRHVKFMTLRLLRKLDDKNLTFGDLRKHGLKSCVQGQCYVYDELQKYIDEQLQK